MCDIEKCAAESSLPLPVVDAEQRRLFLKGMASLPLAAILAYPELARAAADSTEQVSLSLGDGRRVEAALALPDAEKAPTVMLIHEWWGLNDQIKSVAAELARLGYVALAVDLYHGEVATTRDGARALMGKVDASQATTTLDGWNSWLRGHPRSTGKLGTVGWCFGGGWSLNASISSPADATVVYYGNVAVEVSRLAKLRGPVLGHFATEDGWIDRSMVSGFESAMAQAGKSDSLEVHWYEANHGFANPTSARYDEHSAALSWERTRAFFENNLG